VEAAGLNYDTLRKKAPMRSWTKDKIVEEMIRRNKAGMTIKGGDMSVSDSGFYHTVKRHFGKNGWSEARTLAGFDPVDPAPWKIWTKKKVREEINRLSENGVDLSVGFLQKSIHSKLLAGARKAFGSWAKAIRACGLDYGKIRKCRHRYWTRERVLARIRSLQKRGIRLSHKQIQKAQGGLLQGAIKHFGSWSQAVEAAGIPYKAHCRTWSTKAWLRRITPEEYEHTIHRSKVHAKRRKKHEKKKKSP